MNTPLSLRRFYLMPVFVLALLVSVATANEDKTQPTPQVKKTIPKMIDFGADKCVPCKAMAPILKELQKEYAGRVEVVFVDVWKNQKTGQEAKIRLIPTQVFYDVAGKELARHEGFMSKEDILGQWRKLNFLPAEKK